LARPNERYALRAYALRQELGLGYGRVDPVAVLRSLAVEVQRLPFEHGTEFDGAFEFRYGASFVLLNTDRPPLRQRFTAAHELGHQVFDRPTDGRDFTVRDTDVYRSNDSQHHRGINTFAGAFLIDPFGVRDLVDRGLGGHELVAQVIATFEVSVQAAALELKDLGHLPQTTCDEAFSAADTTEYARTHGATLTLSEVPAFELDPVFAGRVVRGYVEGRLSEAGVAATLGLSEQEAMQFLGETGALEARAAVPDNSMFPDLPPDVDPAQILAGGDGEASNG
jgi:Zn-dependent peptidase ImmA (M78 family)